MEQFLSTETLLIALLLVAALVAIAVRRLRLPYTVGLVLAGLLITFQRPVDFTLTPELILALFVPPLVFEAAFHLNLAELRQDLPIIVLLTVPGVILTTLIIGGMIGASTTLSLPAAFVFGALISATDPVAVVALFKTLGAPRRLTALVESESLLNDGTALVLFNPVLAAALSGHFNVLEGVVDFVRVAAGGIALGAALGWLTARLMAHIDDYLIETTLTSVLAYGAYLAAERLQVSGVLAVVAAGLIMGNLGPQSMSPTTRIVLFNFWEYVAFLANSFIFLLIGLQVNLPELLGRWPAVGAAIAAVLAARVIIIYGLSWVGNRFRGKRFTASLPKSWQHILSWGGLRGALSLALVLSVPAQFGPERELLRVMTLGVVLFTLLVQGTTMRSLLQHLRIVERMPQQLLYELRHGRLAALRIAEQHLAEEYQKGLLTEHTWHDLRAELERRAQGLAEELHAMVHSEPSLGASEMRAARQEMLRAQRSALMDMQRNGVISEQALERLAAEVDAALAAE